MNSPSSFIFIMWKYKHLPKKSKHKSMNRALASNFGEWSEQTYFSEWKSSIFRPSLQFLEIFPVSIMYLKKKNESTGVTRNIYWGREVRTFFSNLHKWIKVIWNEYTRAHNEKGIFLIPVLDVLLFGPLYSPKKSNYGAFFEFFRVDFSYSSVQN